MNNSDYTALPGIAITPDIALKLVCDFTGYDPEDVVKRCRYRELVDARALVITYLRSNTELSWRNIANYFHMKSHASAYKQWRNVHEIRQVSQLYESFINSIKTVST